MGKFEESEYDPEYVEFCEQYYQKYQKQWPTEVLGSDIFNAMISFPQYILRWFNPTSFDWKGYSWALARYCNKDFLHWWVPEKFDYELGGPFLKQYCQKFEKIWMPDYLASKIVEGTSQ